MCWVFGCSGSVVNGALEYISTDLGFATDAVKQGTPFLDNMFLISQSLLLSLQNIWLHTILQFKEKFVPEPKVTVSTHLSSNSSHLIATFF